MSNDQENGNDKVVDRIIPKGKRTGPRVVQPRITISGFNLHYESFTNPAQSFSDSYSKLIEGKEDVYARDLKNLPTKWTQLHLAWLEEIGCSTLVLKNSCYKPFQENPTEEQLAELDAKRILLIFSSQKPAEDAEPHLFLHYKGFQFITPTQSQLIWYRASMPGVSMYLFATPK